MCSVILTCSVSNVCWTEDVSVIVRWKYVLFCSMFGKDSPWTVHGLLVDQLLSMDSPWLAVFGVRCSMFGCSVFDVMFGEKYVFLFMFGYDVFGVRQAFDPNVC